jgi:hypothetical protein
MTPKTYHKILWDYPFKQQNLLTKRADTRQTRNLQNVWTSCYQ